MRQGSGGLCALFWRDLCCCVVMFFGKGSVENRGDCSERPQCLIDWVCANCWSVWSGACVLVWCCGTVFANYLPALCASLSCTVCAYVRMDCESLCVHLAICIGCVCVSLFWFCSCVLHKTDFEMEFWVEYLSDRCYCAEVLEQNGCAHRLRAVVALLFFLFCHTGPARVFPTFVDCTEHISLFLEF